MGRQRNLLDWPVNLFDKIGVPAIDVTDSAKHNLTDFIEATLEGDKKTALYLQYRDNKTLREIGQILDRTPERIRQINAKSLRLIGTKKQDILTGRSLRAEYRQLEAQISLAQKQLEALKKECAFYQGKIVVLKDLCSVPSSYDVKDVFKFSETELLQANGCLSVRSFNILARAGIKTLYDLSCLSIADIKSLRYCGRKSLLEIISFGENNGITFSDVTDNPSILILDPKFDNEYTRTFDHISLMWDVISYAKKRNIYYIKNLILDCKNECDSEVVKDIVNKLQKIDIKHYNVVG